MEISPSGLRFTERTVIGTVDVSSGYINYELVYSGTDGQSLKISYREYTSDNLARASFYQDLVFNLSQPTIGFRDVVIEVHAASNEAIEYTVISDIP